MNEFIEIEVLTESGIITSGQNNTFLYSFNLLF